MNEHKEVALHTDTLSALHAFLVASGDRRSIGEVIDLAVKAWLAQSVTKRPTDAVAASRGYLWKSLFLPEGSLLRLDYKKRSFFAQVSGDAIVYDGRPFSPRQLVLHLMGGVRNPWKELWIRCPGDARWHLADTRRRILRKVPPPANVPAAISHTANPHMTQLDQHWVFHDALQAHLRAGLLHRGDLVSEVQPDLTKRLPAGRGNGPWQAGRAGPPDRRMSGLLRHGPKS